MSYIHSEYVESVHVPTRTSYERFLEFERLMKLYPSFSSQRFNPTPLGFCAFALPLFIYSMYNAGVAVPVTASHHILIGIAFFYGGLIQLLAGLLEFRQGHNIYALTFCSYGGFWLGLAALDIVAFSFSLSMDETTKNNALGIFFVAWLIFTLAMLISSLRTNLVFIGLLFFLTITFTLLVACKFQEGHLDLQRSAGAFGILTAVIAWYAAFASLLKRGENSYFSLPIFNLAPAIPMLTFDEPLTDIRSHKL